VLTNAGSAMNRISPLRVILFVCVLVGIILFTHSVQNRREEQKVQAAAQVERETAETNAAIATGITNEQIRQKALQDAAAEHEKFLIKYVDTNITKRVGSQMVAVAVVSENRAMNHSIGAALVNHFKTQHVQLTDSFFKPEWASDGLFNSAFNGSIELFNKLELPKTLDALLLARQEVQYETNADLNNIVTANMHLEIVTLPVAGNLESRSWTFTANGAGFRRAEARIQAEERIIKQIETDTKMTLGTTPP
jgi:hypothetical protein